MTFANPVPPWALALGLVAIIALVLRTYAGTQGLVSRGRRLTLMGLRGAALVLIALFLLNPVIVLPQAGRTDAVVPVLIDNSRSMRLADVDGKRRIDVATDLVRRRIQPALDAQFKVDVLTAGEGLAETPLDRISPDARGSDLRGALAAARERYHGQRVAGIVLLSDGADTGAAMPLLPADADIPVFAVGIGAPRIARDREVLGVSVGDPALSDSNVDLSATIVSHGFGSSTPVEIRVLENGRPVHVRRITPADGVPYTERFRVAPRQDAASVYSVELRPEADELTDGNNRYAVLVRPPGRARRLLLVEGAPGYEHSFIKRAWQQDRGLEIDSVVRKGTNDRGEQTYYVQAAKTRANLLAAGYPSRRDVLFTYDLIVLANVESGLLTREQLALTADFAAERGGGVLMLGSRSLALDGLSKTPLEELMPVEASDRVGRAMVTSAAALGLNRVSLTPEGERHPVMQLGATLDEARKQWALVPPLGASTALGSAKPGAAVLAITNGPGGRSRPLVAVQRYGHGRTMVFAGEASWRWKMGLPSTNRTYETFWRQAGRWLAAGAPEPVALTVPSLPVGSTGHLDLDVRDAEFHALQDVSVLMRVIDPAGGVRELAPVQDTMLAGRHSASFSADHGGLYRVEAEVRRGTQRVGTARDWMLVGGADRELTDPKQNADVLRRLAADSGGALLDTNSIGDLRARLARSMARAPDAPRRERELWHTPWAFLLLVGLVSMEWGLRRRWGLR